MSLILHLPSTTSTQIIHRLKAIFARFGIPDEMVSDNGPQFSSAEFKELGQQMDIKHLTSSPHHPQGNGHAERAVQTAKRILKEEDPLLALMCYRSTPCATTGVSPAELLMGRKIRTTLPTLEKNLQPKWPNRKTAFYYNRRHGARPLSPLRPGDAVVTKLDQERTWVTPAVVDKECVTPRSYLIHTPHGTLFWRNRRHLHRDHSPQLCTAVEPSKSARTLTLETTPSDSGQVVTHTQSDSPAQVRTRSRRVCKSVIRLDL
uniref:Integrase catalytic domain-containing protein n=1 Tax=Amphilophus citrinellus TaxID=61819 RepID=A0A3Q0S4A5_AMPCI